MEAAEARGESAERMGTRCVVALAQSLAIRGEMEMHIFTELVGIQMLLMNTLEPLLRGDKAGPGTARSSIPPSSDNQGHASTGTPRQAQPE